MASEEKMYRYVTSDPDIVARFLKNRNDRAAWGDRIREIAERLGRQPVVSMNVTGERFTAFSRKKGESPRPADYAGTQWVLTDHGHLRPRATHKDGKRLLKEMETVGSFPHPCHDLVGIPKFFNLLSTPGMMVTVDGKRLIVSYGEPVKHDSRWQPIAESAYWLEHEASERKEAAPHVR